jgi:hypothetical protein
MANSYTRGVWTFAVLFIGLATVLYAAQLAYENSNQSAPVIENLQPVIETAGWALPIAVLVVVAMSLVGAAAWLLSQASPEGSRR